MISHMCNDDVKSIVYVKKACNNSPYFKCRQYFIFYFFIFAASGIQRQKYGAITETLLVTLFFRPDYFCIVIPHE